MIPQILKSRFDAPHLIHPGKAMDIAGALARRENLSLTLIGSHASAFDERGVATALSDEDRQIGIIENGVMVIQVAGTLVQNEIGSFESGVTGYDFLGAQIAAAERRGDVHGVVLEISSSGGEVGGLFPLADQIAALEKPTLAIVNDHAFSAAYALAASCDRIVIDSYTGAVGSIGVVSMHVDMSAYLARQGFAVTLIHAGAKKTDGNPYEPLPESVRAEVQMRVDRLYGQFIAHVARTRGLSEADIRATEAGIFDLEEAVSRGLADAVGDPRLVLADFISSTITTTRGGPIMADKTGGPSADKPDAPALPDTAAIAADARSAERARSKAITAAGREAGMPLLADALLDTELAADAAGALLLAAKADMEAALAVEASKKVKPGLRGPLSAALDAQPEPAIAAEVAAPEAAAKAVNGMSEDAAVAFLKS